MEIILTCLYKKDLLMVIKIFNRKTQLILEIKKEKLFRNM